MERASRGQNPLDPLGNGGSAHRPPPSQQQQQENYYRRVNHEQQRNGSGFIEGHPTLFFVIHLVLFLLIGFFAARILLRRAWYALTRALVKVGERYAQPGAGQQQQQQKKMQ